MIFDFHVHSNNSFDSKEKIIITCEEALKKGISDLAFTEHFSVDENKKTFGSMDFKKYFSEIDEAKSKFPSMNIYVGLELCEPHLKIEDFKKELKELPLDFVLGSIHNIGEKGLRTTAHFYNSTKCYEAYFNEVLNMVSMADFDIAAHIDLMARYAYDSVGGYDFSEHREVIEEILKKIISRDKGIEINTSGLRNSLKSVHPKIEIVQLYKDLGGKIITIGSDAHKASDVGEGCNEALRLIEDLGFEYTYTFKNRQAMANKIK